MSVLPLSTVALMGLLAASGCWTMAPVCAEGACPEGTVCELDGQCRALGNGGQARFARAVRLEAADWTSTRSDHRRYREAHLDELLLGGALDGRVYLRFPLPAHGRLVSAVLTLYPAEGLHHAARQEVQAYSVSEFQGVHTSAQTPPRLIGVPGPRRQTSALRRAIRLDVTRLAKESTQRWAARFPGEAPEISLGVRAEGSDVPWRMASPSASDLTLRPHLDIRLR